MTTRDEAYDAAMRYIHLALEAHREGKKFPEAEGDIVDAVSSYVNSKFSKDEEAILHAYGSLQREFGLGHRCSVCGRTMTQNAAIGYDCVREC